VNFAPFSGNDPLVCSQPGDDIDLKRALAFRSVLSRYDTARRIQQPRAQIFGLENELISNWLNDVCSSRILPTLEDVVNQTAHFPFALGSFINFLSLNDQLRPLEFIVEARRYRRSYYSVFQQLGGMEPPSQRRLWHLSLLWQRLLDN
jgi:hypothetical protein